MTYANRRQADIRAEVAILLRQRDARRASANKYRQLNPDIADRHMRAAERHQTFIDRLKQELSKWEAEI